MTAPQNHPRDIQALLNQATWRYVPLLFLAYVVAIVDRANAGFAKLQMQQALQFSDVVYGLGAGAFSVGYFLFEVPSNMLLARVGARRWIARILILWGPIAAATAWVRTPTQFYLLRFLLGVGEAGLFPGIVLLLTYWFPAARRTRHFALVMLGMPVAGVLIGPLSAAIVLGCHGRAGLAGWQWLFILQGLPASLLGLAVLAWLDDRPANARWLTVVERTLLQRELGASAAPLPPWRAELRQALVQPGLRPPTLTLACLVASAGAFATWGPQLLADLLATGMRGVGAAYASMFLLGTLSMLAFGTLADHGRRDTILVALMGTSAAAFFAAAIGAGHGALTVVAVAVGVAGLLSSFPLFWGCVTPRLPPGAAAASIALVNSLGNLGGAAGPALLGPIKQYGGPPATLAALGLYLALGAVCARALRRRP
ncbi:MAG: MFS transporter [Pseudomonadota bacterium]